MDVSRHPGTDVRVPVYIRIFGSLFVALDDDAWVPRRGRGGGVGGEGEGQRGIVLIR